jgi:gluconolactonase
MFLLENNRGKEKANCGGGEFLAQRHRPTALKGYKIETDVKPANAFGRAPAELHCSRSSPQLRHSLPSHLLLEIRPPPKPLSPPSQRHTLIMKLQPRNRRNHQTMNSAQMDRRAFLGATLTWTAAAALAPKLKGERDWTGRNPVRYPDPDIIQLDPRFSKYKLGNTPIQRLHTGTLWAEGPAWNAVGRYLLWSDIPNDIQLRRLDENGKVSVFRNPAGNSNGNTFDFEGRQLACEHGTRRVVRYEHDGTTSILAEKWEEKPLNAPNDVVVHPDGGIWFTDPGYGSMMNYEGNKGELHIKEAIYRIDPQSGKMDLVTDDAHKPNGLCFSPDYKKLYVSDTGGPSPRGIKVWDVTDKMKLSNGRLFTSMALEGKGSGGADGIRADLDGNIWASAGWVGAGYDGVHIFAPEGDRIGQILLPEICSNVCFGGAKRNRLFMTASQSLYAVYVETQGAHIT